MGRADGAISASATHQSHLPAGQLGNLDQSLAAAGEMRSMRVQPNVITYNSSFSDLLRSSQIFRYLYYLWRYLGLLYAVVVYL